MQTITLLNKLDNIAENNIDALSSFNWSDINECILLELSLLSGLYDSQQSLNIQNRISFILSSCEQYTRLHNTPRLRNCLAELIGIVTALPSSAHYDAIQAQNRFEHAALHHYRNNTTIVLGDSHVNFFSGNELLTYIPLTHGINLCPATNGSSSFTVLYLGAALAYTCCKTGTSVGFYDKVLYLLSDFIRPAARIIVSLGEIDVRVHIFQQTQKRGCSYQTIADDILNKYFSFLLFLKSENFEVSCWGPIASQKDDSPQNPDFPRFGTEVERNLATEYFNKRLAEFCAREDITFLSIFSNMITDDHHTRAEYLSSDHFHLSQSARELADPVLKRSGFII